MIPVAASAPFAPLARLVPTFLVLAALGLAGCADDAAVTHIVVDFGGRATAVHEDVQADLSSRPAQEQSEKDGVPHPDAFTAHDQLVAWAGESEHTFAATAYKDTGFGAGYFLTAIDGVSADGSSAFWSLSINGQEVSVGMSEAVLKAGDTVTWTYTALSADVAAGLDPDPIGVTIDPPVPTREETATLTGSVNHDATVSIDGGARIDVKAGRWELGTPALEFGRTTLTLRIEDGVHSIVQQVVFVRLASATIDAVYTMSPGHDPSSHVVWYDPSVLASATMYEGTEADRATTYTVHDLMVDWTTQTGTLVEYSSPGAFGFGVNAIDGIGQPLSASLPPYWCYTLNGATADLGISLQTVAPGDVVVWEYSTCV